MSNSKFRFVSRNHPSQRIWVEDSRSAEILFGILKRLEPGQWILQKEVILEGQPTASILCLPRSLQRKRPDQRRFERFNMEFKVILICEGQSFRTYSDNVSIGGMHLKHKVPLFMINHFCRVILSHHDSFENIEFNCRIFGHAEDLRRVEFLNPDAQSLQLLEKWIHQRSILKSEELQCA